MMMDILMFIIVQHPDVLYLGVQRGRSTTACLLMVYPTGTMTSSGMGGSSSHEKRVSMHRIWRAGFRGDRCVVVLVLDLRNSRMPRGFILEHHDWGSTEGTQSILPIMLQLRNIRGRR